MNWKAATGLAAALLILVGAWFYEHRSEALYDRIIHQQGYEISLIQEQVAVEFFLQPEWIPDERDEETILHLTVEEMHDTKIILEKVRREGNQFYIELDANPSPNRISGQLLTTSYVNSDGSYSTSNFNDRWIIMDHEKKKIDFDGYGMGDGPGNLSSFSFDDRYLEQIDQGAYIRFSGYNLYGYRLLESGVKLYIDYAIFLGSLIALMLLYRKRTEQENGLGLKLVGYTLLGGFTFAFNDFKLPLGFFIYLVFFQYTSSNRRIKHLAALLGLALYVWRLF
ncbi:hypothetical protein [Marinicrinis lubricantis]|uniref:Uncharacterized protein n=1 Tax=Marinicrinis lubricantis TaxID=2086470 RepID=A0ABW1INF9_9BACL